MSWATPADVIDSWVGKNAPTDEAKVQAWIDRAERLIRRRLPDLQARLDDELDMEPPTTDLRDTVVDVVVAMVTEVFRNPEGMRSIQTATGPYSSSQTFGGDNPGKLVLSPADEAALSGSRPGESFAFDLIGGH